MYKVVKRGWVMPLRFEGTSSHGRQKGILDDLLNELDDFEPSRSSYSTQWVNWIAELDIFTCLACRMKHGEIYSVDDRIMDRPPLHEHCRCAIKQVITILSGRATRDGLDGADYWLKNHGILPENYITKADAKALGWRAVEGNLDEVAPDKMIGGDVYKNRNGHLPEAVGRIWYEADINYTGGYRTRHRILYSNDGLVFVTYDHYETFWEVV